MSILNRQAAVLARGEPGIGLQYAWFRGESASFMRGRGSMMNAWGSRVSRRWDEDVEQQSRKAGSEKRALLNAQGLGLTGKITRQKVQVRLGVGGSLLENCKRAAGSVAWPSRIARPFLRWLLKSIVFS